VATTGRAPRGYRVNMHANSTVTGNLHTQGGKPTPAASPRLTAGGTPASAAGAAQNGEKECGFTPCERGRARAWVHGYVNGTCGASMCTPAPRPSPKVRTAVATWRPVHEQRKGWTASELHARCCRLRHLQKSIRARHEGRASHSAMARRRGGVSGVSFQALARWSGFTEETSDRSSPEWPRVEVQASVKIGGVARRWEGTRRRLGDVEAEETGALGDGGSGSSHGWLRPSRRTAFPTLSFQLLLPFFSFSPSSPSPAAVWTGEESPPRRLGLGEPGGCGVATYSGGRTGTRGRPRCNGGARGHAATAP
jgi:hypothetical protein